MKKPLLYFFAFAVTFASTEAFAQRNNMQQRQAPHAVTTNTEAKGSLGVSDAQNASSASMRDLAEDPFYTDDFSDFSLWIPESEGQGQFEWATQTPTQLVQYMGTMNTTTDENGFALFNGIQYLLADNVDPQDATLTYDGSFDFTNETSVSLQFEQRYRAFNADDVSFELSVDGGANWIEFSVNEAVVGNDPSVQNIVITDVSEVVANQPEVLLRFRWFNASDNDDTGSGYGWMIDDLAFAPIPENSIALASAYYNDWTVYKDPDPDNFNVLFGPDIDMVDGYEYAYFGQDFVRPLSFTAEVVNDGGIAQTNVTFNVTLTDPDGMTYEYSESIESLPAGAREFIVIEDVVPEPFHIGEEEVDAVLGTYTVSYSVEQDEEDFFPTDNVVADRTFRVAEEYVSHSRPVSYSYSSSLAGSEYEAVSRYSFNEPTEINFIEFALTTGPVNPEDILFETINLNVFTGSVFADQAAPNDELVNLFEVDGNGVSALNYFITDTDIFNETPSAASETQWVRVMFPEPIAVSPGVIYNAEVGVGSAPDIGGITDFLWPLTSGGNSANSSHWFGPFEGAPTSLFIGRTGYTIRLGNADASTINTETSEPVTFLLGQNYPNPTNGTETLVDWELLEPANNITFTVHDMQGKVVDQRNFGSRPAGKQEVIRLNTDLAAGVYQYSLIVGNYRAVRKMVVTK